MKRLVITLLLILTYVICEAQCAGLQTTTVNPLPINGTYAPNTTVTFCYSMNGYFQNGSNWVDGFDITLGPGWDLSTLTAISSPNSCDGGGQWGWYNSVTSSNTGQTFGPGFFYDRFILDGNPGNDFGDYTVTGTCQWDLCFSVSTAPNCTGQDLSMFVTATGDGTSGSWFNQSCPGVAFQLVSAVCAQTCNLGITGTSTNPSCYNVCDGSINIVVDSGLAPIQFIWNTGSTLQSLSGLCDGNYSVTVTDQNSCTVVDNFNLIEPNQFQLDSNVVDISCTGNNDGSISLFNQVGGTAPYTYNWNTSSTNDTITGLQGGNYTVTVTDQNNCNYIYSYTVIEPTPLVPIIASINANCKDATNGEIMASATGGVQPYHYDWIIDTAQALIGLAPGTYSVTITDANGCTTTISDSIGYNNLFSVDAGDDVTILYGENTILYATVYPYNSSYTYSWYPEYSSNLYNYVTPDSTTEYTVVVHDNAGCVNIDTVTVYVKPLTYFYIPNAFTPNNDGYNEYFFPKVSSNVQLKSFRIYSRWGEMMYNGDNDFRWDGRYHSMNCSTGVYVYVIEYTAETTGYHMVKGDVTLIR